MPRREDERQTNLTGRHPAYCTCTECTDRFLKKKGIRGKQSLVQRLLGRTQVKRHPTNCSCATCNLLRSVDDLPPVDKPPGNRPGGGLFNKLFGKK